MANENDSGSGLNIIHDLWKRLANLIKTLIGDVDLTKGDLQTQINEAKKSVSDGKTLVAGAITEKGVETAADATFAVMADNISQIVTGVELHGAIISVTTDEETLVGKDVVLSKEDVVVETVQFDSNGICSFIVQESGDYVASSSDGSESTSESITVTNDNIIDKTVLPITLTLYVDGATVIPVEDVMIWLKCGSVKGKNYTTVDEVIADTDTLFLLMSDENAMKYLERSTGFADAICADETAMTYLGQSPYVDGTVLNSDLWINATFNSTYFLQIYDDLIPQATGNTMSYGTFEGTYDTIYNCCYPFQAFNKYPGYRWSGAPGYSNYDFWNFMDSYASNTPGYLTFKGNRKIKPMFIQVSPVDTGSYSSPSNEYDKRSCIKSFTLSYSIDNNNFVKLQDYLLSDNYEQEYSVIKNGSHPSHIFKIDNPVVCSGFSFSDVTSFVIGAGSATAGEIYIYGRII